MDLEDEMFTRITICTYAMLVYGGDRADPSQQYQMITQIECGEAAMLNSSDCNVFTTFFDDSIQNNEENSFFSI